ncbi:class I SAM-dependent methyltransferase [Neobacillus drentensis]|uniref:class I SAM-dependent methyltransferase n=1 Tax=Neobacillus drentensis TaxID=220684 RepID=UPI001F32F1DD|nr:class I SAM-dependent methyltransferase [Neobacillus drentensis]ULT55108.1 class I SAM-dependent methyltransferase [Neobacillus drentensis]
MSRRFAEWYDFFMRPLEKRKFKRIREELLSKADGYVLEIGSGTGINFPLYKSVEKVVATEPSTYMINKSQEKLKQSSVKIELVKADAEKLPFGDNTFDTVVATLVFCTIPNPNQAMKEMLRVCKPEGKLLFFEHVKMENRFLAALQEWLTPAWKRICDGCCLNRDTLSLLKNNDLIINEFKSYYNGLFLSVETKKRKS